MVRNICALLGIFLLSLLGACAESPPLSDDYQASAYDPSVSYVAVAEYPDRLYYFGPGCAYGAWGCASYVPVRVGYWPANVTYYTNATRSFVPHERWVGYAGHHWNHNTLMAHNSWNRSHGRVVPNRGGLHNVNYNTHTGTHRTVYNDGRGHVSPPSGGRTPSHVTQPVHRPPTVHQPVYTPPRTVQHTPPPRPAPVYHPAPPRNTYTPPPRSMPVRRCGGHGQPRC